MLTNTGEIGSFQVLGMWAGRVDMSKPPKCPLEEPDDGQELSLTTDTYSGPISSRALALLEYCGNRSEQTPNIISLPRLGRQRASKLDGETGETKAVFLEKFIKEMQVSDQARVDAWQKVLIDRRSQSVHTSSK
jgi:hypothetical protein